jgi:hypothetical protein
LAWQGKIIFVLEKVLIEKFRNLEVWKEAIDLTSLVYALTKKFQTGTVWIGFRLIDALFLYLLILPKDAVGLPKKNIQIS